MAAAEAGEGYIGYYDGGAFGIPHSSKNKEAALLWLQYIGQPAVQADWAVAGARIVHDATYDDPKVQEQDAKVDGYYPLMRDKGPLFAGAPPYPFHGQVREAVAPFIYQAIVGTLTPEEVNEDRLKFAQTLMDEADDDIRTLGLELDVLKIQNVTDEVYFVRPYRSHYAAIGPARSAALTASFRF